MKSEKPENLESVEAFGKKNKKMKRKRTIVDYMARHEEAYKNNKIKSIIDFDEQQTNSKKSSAVEKKSSVKLTTRFMKGKMLMFANFSSKFRLRHAGRILFSRPSCTKNLREISR